MHYLIVFALILGAMAAAPLPTEAARLWSSGCELQGDSPGNATAALEFDNVQGTSADSSQIIASTKRSGLSSCASIRATTGWSSFYHEFLSTALPGPFYFRTYLYISTMPAEDAEIIVYENADDNRSALILNSDGTLDIRSSDDSTILDSDATVLTTGVWYRIEYKYDDNSTVQVRLDGSEILSAAADGSNVQAIRLGLCATGLVAGVACGGDFLTTGTLYFDDIAFNDSTGSAQTSWPGAGSIVHMQPDGAGDTDNSTTTPNGWQQVDETTPDDSTSAAWLANDGDILDVNFESSANAGIDSYDTVTLVQGGIREKADSAAIASWQLGIKSQAAGTLRFGTVTTHNDATYRTNGDTAPRNYTATAYVDPQAGGAWTPSLLDTMQLRASTTDANPDVGITTLWALVEYIDGIAPAIAERMRIRLQGARIKVSGGRIRLQSN